MKEYKAIIVGAGLGGLVCAAELSKKNKAIVLEKSEYLGGRCSSRTINGCTVDIGAVMLGGAIKKIIRKLESKTIFKPVKYQIFCNNKFLTMPQGLHTFNELKKHGVKRRHTLKFIIKSLLHKNFGYLSNQESFNHIVHNLTNHDSLRNYLKSASLLSGAHPEDLPAEYFKYFFLGHEYRFDNPVYPLGGTGAISDGLSKTINRNNGIIKTNSEVKKNNTRVK
ncbi:MAG: NAD(P)-binding protein [Candidatus Diapherotrites archaeon]